MKIPIAMHGITKNFHQDIFLLETTIDGIVNYGIRSLSSSDAKEAKHFLTSLLDGSNDTRTIRNIWDSLPKDIRIDNDQEVIKFLRHIRDALPTA